MARTGRSARSGRRRTRGRRRSATATAVGREAGSASGARGRPNLNLDIRESGPRAGGSGMVQKVIDVVGVSGTSFAAAAKNAVQEAGKTVRGMKWGRVSEFEVSLDNGKVTEYRATVRIYFDLEQ